MLLENWKLVSLRESPLEWPHIRCWMGKRLYAHYSWSAARETAITSPGSQNNIQMDIFLHRHWPQHIGPLQANSKTRSHARLATFTFHFSTISSRDESIRAAQCNRRVQWVKSASQTGVYTSNHLLHFKLIHILMGDVNGTDLPPMMVSYLLWGREAAPHWLGWMSTSWRTPPPRPRHSRSRSTGREEGHRPRRKGAERGAEHLLTDCRLW